MKKLFLMLLLSSPILLLFDVAIARADDPTPTPTPYIAPTGEFKNFRQTPTPFLGTPGIAAPSFGANEKARDMADGAINVYHAIDIGGLFSWAIKAAIGFISILMLVRSIRAMKE